jgi:hypothetical protein
MSFFKYIVNNEDIFITISNFIFLAY